VIVSVIAAKFQYIDAAYWHFQLDADGICYGVRVAFGGTERVVNVENLQPARLYGGAELDKARWCSMLAASTIIQRSGCTPGKSIHETISAGSTAIATLPTCRSAASTIGAALYTRCLELGWIEARRDTRALAITTEGARGFARSFGVALGSK
jgi:hypothetical protein